MNANQFDQRSWFARNRARLLMAAIYLTSYIVLSMLGDYYWSMSGQRRYVGGMAIPDRVIWHPQFLYWEPYLNIAGDKSSHGNLPGYFYSPLIWIDRAWWHRTIKP